MARRVWPGEDPVGKRVKVGSNAETQPWTTIVGVVGSTRHFGLDIAPQPSIYVRYAENPLSAPILVIRTGGDPLAMVNPLSARYVPLTRVFRYTTYFR